MLRGQKPLLQAQQANCTDYATVYVHAVFRYMQLALTCGSGLRLLLLLMMMFTILLYWRET